MRSHTLSWLLALSVGVLPSARAVLCAVGTDDGGQAHTSAPHVHDLPTAAHGHGSSATLHEPAQSSGSQIAGPGEEPQGDLPTVCCADPDQPLIGRNSRPDPSPKKAPSPTAVGQPPKPRFSLGFQTLVLAFQGSAHLRSCAPEPRY